ncbi:hypothetical protein [Amycolatopsis sp. NPDC051102]|uniref:hypothetical protein n=1 Tax=Amycolatopsis sp. NPDC051102 TaxID=3155163 RepID=UPI003417FAC7
MKSAAIVKLGHRSKNQILFNALPEQTIDIDRRIWKVQEWIEAQPVDVDSGRLREHLLREIYPWSSDYRDNGFKRALERRDPLQVRSVNIEKGVRVEPFPKWYECRGCHAIGWDEARICSGCNRKRWGQLHFVGYHECGILLPPFVAKCPKHEQLKIIRTASTKVSQIEWGCPKCSWRNPQKGLGIRKCPCGGGHISYNVHRASSVYVAQVTTLINPPSADDLDEIRRLGGATRALHWALGGMIGHTINGGPQTRADIEALLANLPEITRIAMLNAVPDSEISELPALDGIPERLLRAAEQEAMELALAVRGGRETREVHHGGLLGIDLVDQFPILRAVFGYTRGETAASTLQHFRSNNGILIHADAGMTEALLVRLDPIRVIDWLRADFPDLPEVHTEKDARELLIRKSEIPGRHETVQTPTVGSRVATLIHSYAHRIIRRIAVFAGIDREALSEFLLPSHCAFFVYAQPRGEFVLGGLQALFEDELDRMLADFVEAEYRCPLDPGCEQGGSACPACLHLGEPTCRWFNRHLSRAVLFSEHGYLTA